MSGVGYINKDRYMSDEFVRSPNWKQVKEGHIQCYQDCLWRLFADVKFPVHLDKCDISCNYCCHLADLDKYLYEITSLLHKAASSCLPLRREYMKSKRGTFGWNEFVCPYQETARQSFKEWTDHGRPTTGDLFQRMRSDKKKYKYAVRRLKRHSTRFYLDELGCNLLEGSNDRFWQSVHKMKSSKSFQCQSVNGSSNVLVIAQMWKDHFSKIHDMDNVGVNKSDGCCYRELSSEFDFVVSAEMVQNAIQLLKGNKAAGIDGIYEEHIIYAPGCVVAHLAKIYTAMLKHGYLPKSLTKGLIVPLIKDKFGDYSDMSNYRGITLSSVFCKILELIIKESCEGSLITSDLQFGFKKDHSTTMCSYVVQETIEYFNSRGSPVYACFLDASKAFDRVDHDILFSILRKRGLNPMILRLLEFWYRNLTARVRWSGVLSDEFPVSNGVRQGGVLSPLLFTLYIDDLLLQLSESGHGCRVGGCDVSVVAYADDICILSGSVNGLQALLLKCSSFASERRLVFNANKTKCIRFNTLKAKWISSVPLPTISFEGHMLDFVDGWKHLGHTFCATLSNVVSIDVETKRFFSSFNSFFHVFKGASPIVLCCLLLSYSTIFYGCQLWSCNDIELHRLRVAWNDAVRKICGIGRRCHVDSMLAATGLLPLPDLLRKRKLQFRNRLLRSKNTMIHYLCDLLQLSSRSVFYATCVKYDLAYGTSTVKSHRDIGSIITNYFINGIQRSRLEAAAEAYPKLFVSTRSSHYILTSLFSID